MNSFEDFLRLSDEIAKEDSRDRWTAEPWPDWFQKVVLRLTRVFIPTLKRGDFQKNRARFEGYGLAFISQLTEQAKTVKTSEFPEGQFFEALKKEFEQIATVESERVRKALRAAGDLPPKEAAEVFEAYADGVKKGTATFAIDRLADSQTVQICLFLIFARPFIEDGQVPTVTVLFDNFMRFKEAFPKQKKFFERNPQARANLQQHFRRICTADGVKLARRGKPRLNKTGKRRTR
jgi:hypothetical protein